MFDSPAPIRRARVGSLYTAQGTLDLALSRFREDLSPVEPGCACSTCATFSRAYLHHLFAARELLAYRLAAIHNLYFMLELVARIREAILQGRLSELRRSLESR